jgi:hypothetical protein
MFILSEAVAKAISNTDMNNSFSVILSNIYTIYKMYGVDKGGENKRLRKFLELMTRKLLYQQKLMLNW